MMSEASVSTTSAGGLDSSSLDCRDFRALYDAHCSFVWKTLRRFGVREEDAADHAQAVFLVAHTRLKAFEGRSRLDTWLFSICRRIAWNSRRAQRRRPEIAVDPISLDFYPSLVQDPNEARDCFAKVEAILGTMPWPQCQVFVLSELEQLRGPEIAERLGISDSTVKYRLRTARQLFSRAAQRQRLIPGNQ